MKINKYFVQGGYLSKKKYDYSLEYQLKKSLPEHFRLLTY